jgi:hypothetical protein
VADVEEVSSRNGTTNPLGLTSLQAVSLTTPLNGRFISFRLLSLPHLTRIVVGSSYLSNLSPSQRNSVTSRRVSPSIVSISTRSLRGSWNRLTAVRRFSSCRGRSAAAQRLAVRSTHPLTHLIAGASAGRARQPQQPARPLRHVDVLRHRDTLMPQVVGDLPRRSKAATRPASRLRIRIRSSVSSPAVGSSTMSSAGSDSRA